jgi:hypothetical protein
MELQGETLPFRPFDPRMFNCEQWREDNCYPVHVRQKHQRGLRDIKLTVIMQPAVAFTR